MEVNKGSASMSPVPGRRGNQKFSEMPAWQAVGAEGGWQRLHGGFRDSGCSIEWHDLTVPDGFDWSRSFHPDSVEICLNLCGHGTVSAGRTRLELAPFTAGFYVQRETRLAATRRSGERHQFITIELSAAFLERHVALNRKAWHPGLERLLHKRSSGAAAVSEPIRLTSEQQQLTLNLRNPPVSAAARDIWYHAKVLEVAAAMLYRPQPGDELFCQRQKRLNHERVRKVIALLKENVAEPPALEEIGRRVGCSHFYLSRTFTTEMGRTISQYLRELRMERAAALLREGRLNVLQVALEVGYSSPSHFSAAFHETFGCCPGLYPFATRSQEAVRLAKAKA